MTLLNDIAQTFLFKEMYVYFIVKWVVSIYNWSISPTLNLFPWKLCSTWLTALKDGL